MNKFTKKACSDYYCGLIKNSILFRGMDDISYMSALESLKASCKEYDKDSQLVRMGEPVRAFGMVLEGVVYVCSDDIEGNRMIMAHVTPGHTFGESLSYLGTGESPVYIYAACKSRILWMYPDVLKEKAETDLKNRFTSMLAHRTLTMNDRIQVLSKMTLRNKIIAFLSQRSGAEKSNSFSVSMSREDMATYMGVNRTALSRELAAMKKEGIIDYYRDSFTLIR